MSKIAVVYWSGTGNTEAMALAVLEGAKAAERGVTSGTGGSRFSPNAPGPVEGFPDVAPGAYYARAVGGAAENGITVGTGGRFSPNAACTRTQAVTFLYRLMGE